VEIHKREKKLRFNELDFDEISHVLRFTIARQREEIL